MSTVFATVLLLAQFAFTSTVVDYPPAVPPVVPPEVGDCMKWVGALDWCSAWVPNGAGNGSCANVPVEDCIQAPGFYQRSVLELYWDRVAEAEGANGHPVVNVIEHTCGFKQHCGKLRGDQGVYCGPIEVGIEPFYGYEVQMNSDQPCPAEVEAQ